MRTYSASAPTQVSHSPTRRALGTPPTARDAEVGPQPKSDAHVVRCKPRGHVHAALGWRALGHLGSVGYSEYSGVLRGTQGSVGGRSRIPEAMLEADGDEHW